ncbi:MAG: hypothetical protein K1X35_14135 [Caulobacteraceae bacterium]|nr:hypothetical protein [Caulobacteraceae bacterium]
MAAKIGDRRRGFPWRLVGWSLAGLLLVAPLAAMQVSSEVNWTPSDFAFAAILLGALGLGLELSFRHVGWDFRLASAVALGAAFVIVWSSGAVGIVGGEDNPANRLFVGVLAVAALGSVAGRFRPTGLAWTMAATALAQVAVLPVAATIWPQTIPDVRAPDALVATAAFAAAWLLSAGLYAKAARRPG